MKLLALLTIVLLVTVKLSAQTAVNEKGNPLILIDTLFTYNESMILEPSKFLSISTINAQQAMKMYGATARFGVIKIETKPDIHFMRLRAILDQFRIDEKYRNLKVCINKTLVNEPDKLLADVEEIKNVEIISDKIPQADGDSPKNEFYINIVTQPGQ